MLTNGRDNRQLLVEFLSFWLKFNLLNLIVAYRRNFYQTTKLILKEIIGGIVFIYLEQNEIINVILD